MIIKENEDLKTFVKFLTHKITSLDNNDDNIAIISDMPMLLQALVKCLKDNKNKKPTAWRYKDELIKNYAVFSRDLGGKQSHEFWSKNLPLPALSTVAVYAEKSSKPIIEGEFRFPELVQYLDERNLGREIWLSEDATRIKVQVQYDVRRNQLVGLVPLLDKNGLPKVGSFVADSAENIKTQLSTECASNYEYAIMAQPMTEIPPFLLCMYGTNNKFTTPQVLQRWKWLVQESKKHGVVILGFSSDGDPKMLSAMNKWTFGKELRVLPDWKNIFFASMDVAPNLQASDCNFLGSLSPLCIQDTVHTVAKLKTQLLKDRSDNNFLPMGSYVVSGTFLRILVERHSKLDHGLCISDLDSKDKMNFRSVQKISDTRVRVTDALDNVPGSKATKSYLIMLRGVLDSFLDKTLEPEKRLYLIWRTVFFMRHWRSWLQENNYKVTLNFITANTYQCIEISAHSLVNVYRRCRDSDKLHLFIPWLMGSQACEGFFRDARSCTEMFHTAVNMTAYEFQQKAKKIVRLLQTGHELNKTIIVPRHHKKMKGVEALSDTLRNQVVLTDSDIFKTLSEAQKDALSLAQSIDMVCVSKKSQMVPAYIARVGTEEDAEDEDDDEDSEGDNGSSPADNEMDIPHDVAQDIILDAQNQANIPNDICLPENSPFVVMEEGEKRSIIRKSTLIWNLTSKHTLSSNRLERVKAAEESLRKQRLEESDKPHCAENISVGDWVIFGSCPLPKRYYIGRILNFTYLSGSGKEREYSKCSVPTSSPENNARGIGCLGDWYTLNCDGKGNLEKFHEPAAYLNIKNYICSVPQPSLANSTMSYTAEILTLIKGLLPNNARRASQVSRPVKNAKTRGQGRSLFPDSDTEEDASMDTPQSSEVSRPTVKISASTSSLSEKSRSCPIRMSPRSASPHAASPKESQTKPALRMSPRRSVSPMPGSSTHQPTKKTFAPIERPPEVGEFVLIEFEKKSGPVYYVGKVLSEADDDNDVQVSYLYLRRNVETSEHLRFAFPNLPDEASVNLDSVKKILPKPLCSSTNPQKSFYQFDISLEGLNVY